MTQIKSVNRPNILVRTIQGLLALACVGALLQTAQLSIETRVFAENEFFAVLTALLALALTAVPSIINHFKLMPISPALHTAYVVFVYLAMFFGEMLHFYDSVVWWDSMLHFSSGILFSLFGYMVFLALNKDPDVRNKMHPASIVMFTVIFAMACGVAWEIFEFAGDSLLGANMQRWQNTIPAGEWASMQNVTNLSNPGLMDTMKDFIMDTVGALVSIPIILNTVKKNSQYMNCGLTVDDLLAEMQPAQRTGKRIPVPAASAMLYKQNIPEERATRDAA